MKTPLAPLALCLLVLGCTGNPDGLNDYVDDVKARPAAPIEPLPTMSLAPTHLYAGQEARDPFAFPERLLADDGSGVFPEADRAREPLESFPLDALRMVGTLERRKERWAIFLDSDDLIYRAGIGNYLGRNHGRITGISESGVRLREIVKAPHGGWVERETTLSMAVTP